MKLKLAIAALVLLGALGASSSVASATHQHPGYSPCRGVGTTDDVRLGYEDTEDRDDPRHELPTIYANGSPDGGDLRGNVGACGGSGADKKSIEVGNDSDGPYYDYEGDPATLLP